MAPDRRRNTEFRATFTKRTLPFRKRCRHSGAPSEAGFSLVELLVAMTLLGVLSVLAITLLTSSYRQTRRMSEEFDLRSNGLEFLRVLESGSAGEKLHSGMLAATNVSFKDDADKATFSFSDRDGQTTVYTYEGNSITLELNPGTEASDMVLQDVERFFVCRHDFGGTSTVGQTLRIELHLQKEGPPQRNVELVTEVYLRNASLSEGAVPSCP